MSDVASYYVYAHSHKGIIFYIGCGNSRRAYDDKARSDSWKKKTVKLGDFNVRILFTSEDRKIAHKKERELIYRIKPECNIKHTKINPAFIIDDESGSVGMSILTNTQLTEISNYRRSHNILAWRKKDIIAELVAKAHKKEV